VHQCLVLTGPRCNDGRCSESSSGYTTAVAGLGTLGAKTGALRLQKNTAKRRREVAGSRAVGMGMARPRKSAAALGQSERGSGFAEGRKKGSPPHNVAAGQNRRECSCCGGTAGRGRNRREPARGGTLKILQRPRRAGEHWGGSRALGGRARSKKGTVQRETLRKERKTDATYVNRGRRRGDMPLPEGPRRPPACIKICEAPGAWRPWAQKHTTALLNLERELGVSLPG
jgi:hypothetical protein